jgi:hypothetical protein
MKHRELILKDDGALAAFEELRILLTDKPKAYLRYCDAIKKGL